MLPQPFVASNGSPHDGDLVHFDGITFGLLERRRHTGDGARRRLASGLQAAGLLRPNPHPTAPLRISLTIQLAPAIQATATAVLHVREVDDGLVIASASTLEMNLQGLVRAKHRVPVSLRGLDGKRNFSRPSADLGDDDVELQFEAIRRLVDALRDAIDAALPGSVRVEHHLTFKRGEVCHDLRCPNAEEVARATCRVPPRGSRESWQREYACTTGAGRSPTWHFVTRMRGPEWKGYVKAPGLLRTELRCPHRDSVVHCVGGRSNAPFDGDGAVQLAMEFYEAAGELCCEALDHVRDVARGKHSLEDLLVKLDPIRAIGERDRVGNGYKPGEKTANEARRVFQALLNEGIVQTPGLRHGTKLRDVLEQLAMPGGPLVHGAGPNIFCLAPEYGMALPSWQGQYPLVLRP